MEKEDAGVIERLIRLDEKLSHFVSILKNVQEEQHEVRRAQTELSNRISEMKQSLHTHFSDIFVSKAEFAPIQRLGYALVSAILLAVLYAILKGVDL